MVGIGSHKLNDSAILSNVAASSIKIKTMALLPLALKGLDSSISSLSPGPTRASKSSDSVAVVPVDEAG